MDSRTPPENTPVAAKDAVSPARAAAAAGGEAGSLQDYLLEASRPYALQQLAKVQSLTYFLPLLHELFNGGEARTKLLFGILHTMMTDNRVRWTRADLDEKFHWLKDGHRTYFFARLSSVGWLEYMRDQGVYMMSDKGEALMRMLSRFTLGRELVENEGAALAEIEFSILLEVDDLTDRLVFLRNRLMKHSLRAEAALKSESAYRILEIYQQLQNAYRWAEQTRQTLEKLELTDEHVEEWAAVRSVHDHLSTLHQQISKMQLVLQDIQRKQIDIARYGLTHLDFDNYLIHGKVDTLARLIKRHLMKVPHPFFLNETNAFAEAAHVLARTADTGEPARGWDTSSTEVQADTGPTGAIEAMELVSALAAAPREWSGVGYLLEQTTWEIAAYRFSLLTLLADRDQREMDNAGAYDPFMTVPAEARFAADGEMVPLTQADGVWQHTRAEVRHTPPPPAAPAATAETPPGAAPRSRARSPSRGRHA